MEQTIFKRDITAISALAQKWLTGTIEDKEFDILNSWYYALESVPLGCPDEFTVEKVEKWLYKQFSNVPPVQQSGGISPPWGSLKKE